MKTVKVFWLRHQDLELSPKEFEVYNHQLPTAFQINWENSSLKKQISFKAKVLLGKLLEHEFGEKNALSKFYLDKNGKPFLKDLPLWFNITHSGDFIGLAFSQQAAIGIDIQIHRPVSHGVIQRVCCEEELAVLNENKVDFFFELWTKKEAVIKTSGVGIKTGLSAVSVLNPISILNERGVFVQNIQSPNAYSAALASFQELKSIQITNLSATKSNSLGHFNVF